MTEIKTTKEDGMFVKRVCTLINGVITIEAHYLNDNRQQIAIGTHRLSLENAVAVTQFMNHKRNKTGE